MIKKRIAEYRTLPTNEKGLDEKRTELMLEKNKIIQRAKAETRTQKDKEETMFEDIKKEIKKIDTTLAAIEEERTLKDTNPTKSKKEETRELAEERAFENFIRGKIVENRTGEQNLTFGNNGAVIPTTIANKIIKEVKDRCPILSKATMYSVKGVLKVPVWGKANGTHDITVGYQEEFTELTADSGKFTSVDLGGYLAGALSLIGKSVMNNAQVDVLSFIINEMAEKIALFLENELLNGTGSSAAQGILNGTNVVNAATSSAITADELIEVQSKVKQAYQNEACWVMNSETFTAVKKLKDDSGRYLLQDDITGEFPFRLLGKPVYLSDNMPKIGVNNKTVLYGDLSGLSVNFREGIQIQVLQEKYATQHAVGVVGWFEFDSKITDNQRFAILKMHSA